MSKLRPYLLPASIILLVISAIVTLGLGAMPISLGEVWNALFNEESSSRGVIMQLRLPRVLFALITGCALAVSGAALQGIFRNPLADPSIIGVSSGAAAISAIFIVIVGAVSNQWYNWFSVSALSVVTFIGAVASALLIFKIAKSKRGADVSTMLLAGIAINALSGAIIGLMTYMASDAQLRTLTFWTLGSLGGANWMNVTVLFIVTIVGLVAIFSKSKALNALALGESEAAHLGIHVEKLKTHIVIFTALMVGTSVAFSGIIGFVGLAVPHIIRLIIGADHKLLLPLSASLGALLLLWSDTLARTIVVPAEVPIGVITAMFGAPIFLTLIIKQKTAAK